MVSSAVTTIEDSAGDTVYGHSAHLIDGTPVSLDQYRGQVLLIVNVASRCGFTPQYEGLEALHRRHRERGFSVLGFPCDQFGHQEPGADAEIRRFCSESYDVTFPLFSKVLVKGEQAHPLFRFLTSQQKGWLGTSSIKWNFTKFLVDREGQVISRYGSRRTPASLENDIVRALNA